MNRIHFSLLLALPLLLFAAAGAQTTTTGGIAGVITDSSGAVIPGATISLRNSATGALATTQSNTAGAYRFYLLQPGTYTIVVNQSGFARLATSVEVANSQVVDADLKLQVGGSQQTVEVSAQSELLQAEDADVETTIQQAQMTEVPNSGNNLLFETEITPGFDNIQFGVPGSTTFYQIDGENYNDPYNNANNSGASNLTLGLDDISETSVTANGYSGQFGGLAGSSVSYTSKSGANQLHGDATWYWTGTSMIANTFLHGVTDPITPRAVENANQWAAQISGPVVIPHLFNGHDKLFFLADSEGLRAILPAASQIIAVPSQNLENYTLATLAKEGLSASIPYYQNMFNIYNAANTAHNAQPGDPTFSGAAALTGCGTLNSTDAAALGTLPGACADYYSSAAASYANEALEIFRVDANLGANDKAFIRYEYDTGTQPTYIDPIDPIFNSISIQPQYDGQFNETHTFGTKVVNNFIMTGLWYGALFAPANETASLAAFPAEMTFSDSSFYQLGGDDGEFPEGRNVSTAQFQDDVAINMGAHTLKFGAKAYLIKENDLNFGDGTVPTEAVSTLSAFINGGDDPSSLNNGTYSDSTNFSQTFPERPNYPVTENQLAFYAEDDWKATRSLNLTLTLRAEHQGNISCAFNCLTELASPFVSLNHSASIPYNQAYVFNQADSLPGLQTIEMQPRFGFAYNPTFMQSIVVRGGAGIFYNGLALSILEGIANNPPLKPSFSVSQDNLANDQTSNLYADTQAYDTAFVSGIKGGETEAEIKASLPTPSEQAAFTPPSVYTSQGNFKMYYIEKWNFEVQKLFGSNTSLDLNYLGNHGVHAPFTNAGLNAYSTSGAIAGLPSAIPDPRFGIVYYYTSGGISNYNGLVTTFVHRFDRQSTFTAGYTWGKTMSTGANGFSTTTATSGRGTDDIGAPPNPYNPLGFYGPDSTDQRNSFTANYVYKVPWNNPFYGQWEVSGDALAYSGLPFTAIDVKGSSSINSYSTGNYGASLIADYNGGKEASCSVYSNACLTSSEFSSAASVGMNGPRNAWRGPDYYNTDFNVTKFVPLHWEGGMFSVSLQAFNVLNHPDFTKPSGSLSSGTFGKVTTTINPSGIFSGVGGDDSPRILQFKTKIVF